MQTDKIKKTKLHFEPLFWSLFGNGGTIAAFFFPVLVFLFGILMVIGVYSPDQLYDNLSAFAHHFIGKIIIFIVLAFNFWHACHRIYHGLHDIKIHPPMFVKVIIYGFAAAVNVWLICLLV